MPDHNRRVVSGQPISIKVTSSETGIMAGTRFTLSLQIENHLLEEAVRLTRVQLIDLPPQFEDLEQQEIVRERGEIEQRILTYIQSAEEPNADADTVNTANAPSWRLGAILRRIWPFGRKSDEEVQTDDTGFGIEQVAEDFLDSMDREAIDKAIAEEVEADDLKYRPDGRGNLHDVVSDRVKKCMGKLEELQQKESGAHEIPPRSSHVVSWNLRPRHKLWSRPSSYGFHAEVEYKTAGESGTAVEECVLRIHGSLPAMMVGAGLGGVSGWLVKRALTVGYSFALADILGCIGSALFAVMVTVLLQRKADAEPIVMVNDFYGGVAIGFVSGYCGPEVFSRLILPDSGS